MLRYPVRVLLCALLSCGIAVPLSAASKGSAAKVAAPKEESTFVGSATCEGCHEEE